MPGNELYQRVQSMCKLFTFFFASFFLFIFINAYNIRMKKIYGGHKSLLTEWTQQVFISRKKTVVFLQSLYND